MTHIQLPDSWHSDPRVLALSNAAQAGFVRLLAWCAAYRTDGAIPRAALVALRVSNAAVGALVAAGLVETQGEGWAVINPEMYLFTETMRAGCSAGGQKGMAKRWGHPAPPDNPSYNPAYNSNVSIPSPIPRPIEHVGLCGVLDHPGSAAIRENERPDHGSAGVIDSPTPEEIR